jgi:L-alanine-DL-glutamate epimerase-like enolase superfamily enzyme
MSGTASDARHCSVPLAAVVDDPDAARRAFSAGVRCLKIKAGPNGELHRVFAIATAVPGAIIRVDANRSWPRAEVARNLAALAQLRIEYIEEPCLDAHLLLSERLPCKLALDESLAELTPDELDTALRAPRLAALVLKPTLLGGLSAVLSLAARARAAGIAAIVSHGLEGPIGTAACAELALALGGDRAVGLAPHAAIAGWSFPVPQLAADHVHPARAPGLGFRGLDLVTAASASPPASAVDDRSLAITEPIDERRGGDR